MPESKADRTRRSNEEIVNFLEHGDARGPGWLEANPEARERAQQYLASHYRDLPDSQVDLTVVEDATAESSLA
jgi:hypothetical protein